MSQPNFLSTTTASGETYILRMLPEVWNNIPTIHPPVQGPPRYPTCDCSSGLVDFDVRIRYTNGSGYIRKSFYCIECEIDTINYHLDLRTQRGSAHVHVMDVQGIEVGAVTSYELGELTEAQLPQVDEVYEVDDPTDPYTTLGQPIDEDTILRLDFEYDDETRL